MNVHIQYQKINTVAPACFHRPISFPVRLPSKTRPDASGRHAVSIPIGRPRFSMQMSSPSKSHASSIEKELRKSRTVTVFMMWTNHVHIPKRQLLSHAGHRAHDSTMATPPTPSIRIPLIPPRINRSIIGLSRDADLVRMTRRARPMQFRPVLTSLHSLG